MSKRRSPPCGGMPYRDYLRTAHWQRQRAFALEGAGRLCELCGHDDRLEVSPFELSLVDSLRCVIDSAPQLRRDTMKSSLAMSMRPSRADRATIERLMQSYWNGRSPHTLVCLLLNCITAPEA